MIWSNKFNYPKSVRSIEDGLRKYFLNDSKLPSVTSILQATKSEEEKASLENWKKELGMLRLIKLKMKHQIEEHQCILI